ncbi:MAG: hypothetical protein GY802_09670 [Gammaproteobacteria bacterium]|nr:hypothetical protein [Gammaproteobacteria bacterium]
MKIKLLALAASALLTISLVSSANQAQPQPEVASAPQAATNTNPGNLFDPNYWIAAFNAPGEQPSISGEMTFNAAQPASWTQWVDPKTHKSMHMQFLNPASYTQFMQLQFYMEFAKPENMMSWMNPASYQVMMDPQTMTHWMNPANYMHVADPAMYTETMNPANYMIYLNPATYAGLMGSKTCDQNNPNKTPAWFGYSC